MTGRRRPPPNRRRAGASRCRSCDETVVWCETDKGKSMPVDLQPVEGGTLRMTPRGPQQRPQVVVVPAAERRPGQLLHVSHFARCKGASKHRKQPAKQQGQPSRPEQGELFSSGDAR